MFTKYCTFVILTGLYWLVVKVRDLLFSCLEGLDSFPTPPPQTVNYSKMEYAPYDLAEPLEVSEEHLTSYFNVGVVVSLGYNSLVLLFFNKRNLKDYVVKRYRYADVRRVTLSYEYYQKFLKNPTPKTQDKSLIFESMVEDLFDGTDKIH